jgi:two-component sensor histidine kinase
MKHFFLLFLLISGHFTMAQDFAFDKEFKEIDSLITYKYFDAAEKKINAFSRILNDKYSGKEFLEERVNLHLQQALIWHWQYQINKSLPIFLEVYKEAEENNLYKIACRTKFYIALNYEHAGNTDLAYQYLEESRKMCKKHQFYDLYSTLFIRYAQMHRYFGFEKKPKPSEKRTRLEKLGLRASIDSAFYYVKKAIAYAEEYHNENDLNDGYVVLGILNSMTDNYTESSYYYLKSLPYWKKINNFGTIANMYDNVSSNYLKDGKYQTALKYSDSALIHYKNMYDFHKFHVSRRRSRIFKELGIMDSAYHYLQLAYDDRERKFSEAQLTTTKELEEKYQNDQKEETIKSKNKQMLLIGILLGVIVVASVLLIIQNRRINSRNKIINKQLAELSKTLEQKQVLLSELQHRVKNNLQHVISILEIQKESVDFNNIDELIRGNQNRIHSMALLHKKLNVSDNVNDVDLKRYVTELSELVKESYENSKKKIILNSKCDLEHISIEKALPLGLIITELVSNSMKHAFKKRSIGIITIEITKDQNLNKLYYSDNGIGFDFNITSDKGLGQEIIKGLIDQLDGSVKTNNHNGFELTMYFV